MDRPADPLYTLRVQLVHESSFIQSKSDLFPTLNWINRGGAQSLIIFFHSHIFDLRNHSYLRSGSIIDKLDEKSIGYFRDAIPDLVSWKNGYHDGGIST